MRYWLIIPFSAVLFLATPVPGAIKSHRALSFVTLALCAAATLCVMFAQGTDSVSADTPPAATQPAPSSLSEADFKSRSVYALLPTAIRDAQNQVSLDGTWDLVKTDGSSKPDLPDLSALPWKPAHMPNTVQYALFQAGEIPNPWYGDNWKHLQWIHENDWYLRRSFEIPAGWAQGTVRLRFDGLDYTGVVWVDGKCLGIHEGMFGGPTFTLPGTLAAPGKHEIVVRLCHEPEPVGVSLGAMPSRHAMKSSELDGGINGLWNNRFRSIGIWQTVRLVHTGTSYIEAPLARTETASAAEGTLELEATLINSAPEQFTGSIEARIIDLATNRTVWEQHEDQAVPAGTSSWHRRIVLHDPKLWWPNGMGAQPLYRLELTLWNGPDKSDLISTRFGIRTIELRRNPYLASAPRGNHSTPEWFSDPEILNKKVWPGARWNAGVTSDNVFSDADHLIEEEAMMSADESDRFLFVVNGRPVYCKGASWLPCDDLLTSSPEREAWFIRAAREAGLNLIRLNGGNSVMETEAFYNLCDENGLLVWQELPLTFPDTLQIRVPLITWREQLKSSVLRIRQHPSLAMYAGGNEFMPYLGSLAAHLGIAREIFAAYDNRPFRMSSPGGGTYHAYWTKERTFEDLWGGDPNAYVSLFDERFNFVSEWSYAAYANISLLRRTIPASKLEGPPVGFDIADFFQRHPNIKSQSAEMDRIAKLFQNKSSCYGDLSHASLADLVQYSQLAEAQTYGYVKEHWRSQFPYKGGDILWTFNTSSPGTMWNIIDWYGQPQIAWYAVKHANEPVHVLANVHSFTTNPGETFRATVSAINDGPAPLRGARIKARLLDDAMNTVHHEEWAIDVPNEGQRSPTKEMSWAIPAATQPGYLFLLLSLESENHKLSQQVYWIRIVPPAPAGQPRPPFGTAETLCEKGPWMRNTIERSPTKLDAKILSTSTDGPEILATVSVTNRGQHAAFPVTLAILPDAYSAFWSDNSFWLDPGETVELPVRIRADMSKIDLTGNLKKATPEDLKVEVSAWNAPQQILPLRPPH